MREMCTAQMLTIADLHNVPANRVLPGARARVAELTAAKLAREATFGSDPESRRELDMDCEHADICYRLHTAEWLVTRLEDEQDIAA